MAVESGQTLLHYRLLDRIGNGGMGIVWRATDTSLHRDVAIKVLPDALSQDAERIAAARALSRYGHSVHRRRATG